MNGKLDQAAISNETKEEVLSFLGGVKQSLQDLSKDIDIQLKNVEILESEAATAEEKSAAHENLKYIESNANLRGGVFTEKLLDTIVPNASQAVNAAYENIKGSSKDIQYMEANSDKLFVTNAKTLGLEDITEILTAAKEKVLQKVSAMEAVTTSFSQLDTKLELQKSETSIEKAHNSVDKIISKEIEQSGFQSLLD